MTTVRSRLNPWRIAILIPIALVVGISVFAAVADSATMPATPASSQQPVSPNSGPATSSLPTPAALRLNISFKLDPRLSGGTYGGERWVSPATFTSPAQEGTETKIDAKITALDGRGAPVRIDPTWAATDPSMVTVAPVSPGKTDHLQITVKHVGETKLTISALGVSKELRIKATSAVGPGFQVTISQ